MELGLGLARNKFRYDELKTPELAKLAEKVDTQLGDGDGTISVKESLLAAHDGKLGSPDELRALREAVDDLETGSALRREAPLWLFVAVPMAVVGIAGGAVLAARRAIADLF